MTTMTELPSEFLLRVQRETTIDAPPAVVWQAMIDEMTTESQMMDGVPFPMKLEARPGGRWYRDLGNDAGHLWGHVQVIKPPKLLEIHGPLFMSYAAISHVQYRLAEVDGRTKLTITHRAMGEFPDDHRRGVGEGWDYAVQRIKELAQRRS